MTDKERLEVIKDKQLQMHALSTFDINWLIQQAEKVQELETDKSYCEKKYNRVMSDVVKVARERDNYYYENQRYKEALEFYADEKNWNEYALQDDLSVFSIKTGDSGEKARQALKGETNETSK